MRRIIALGLLVDDAMICVEMMEYKLEQGWDKVRAAEFAYTATAFPMLTGTLVTAAGFMPVAFSAGSASEYCGSMFWVITHCAGILVAGSGDRNPACRPMAAQSSCDAGKRGYRTQEA